MSAEERPALGSICWTDLPVPDAEALREFYRAVIGWDSSALDMGGYDDHAMLAPATGEPVAGSCNARRINAALPAQWLVSIAVEDVEASARECVARGGSLLAGPRSMGGGRYCVIRDPAGADCALYRPPA